MQTVHPHVSRVNHLTIIPSMQMVCLYVSHMNHRQSHHYGDMSVCMSGIYSACPSYCHDYQSIHTLVKFHVYRTDFTTSPSVCQSRQSSVRHTVEPTRPSICHRQYMSVCHTINTTSPSICQPHDMSVHHAMKMSSLSVCQPHDTSIHHTNIKTSPSVCLSKQSSDHHTTSKTSPSLCQSHILSVCHNVIPTSPSVCQFQDSSVCYPTRDVINPTVWQTVCSLSVMSVLPSANPTVKIPMSTPV